MSYSRNPSKSRATTSSIPPLLSRPPAPVAKPASVEDAWFGDGDGGEGERMAEQSMAAMVGRVLGAKPFPETARQLEQLTRIEAPIDKIVRVLESDAALSARLLRLVNSAGYALRIRCTSVRHAAALVGMSRLHQVATTAAILDMFAAGSHCARDVTRHAASVGSLCRYLAVHFGLPRDELATCGFLHDIGKLMLLETEGQAYADLLSRAPHVNEVHELERQKYGFDHGMLASHVLNSWNIPEPIPQVVAWHHQPARAMKRGGQIASMVQVLRLADILCEVLEEDQEGSRAGELAATDAAQYLDISEPQLAAMWPDLVAILDQNRRGGADPSENIAPRTSVSPSRRAQAKRPAPQQFPCGVCSKPSFGSTCSACGAYVCPEHQSGPDGWCSACQMQFAHAERDATLTSEQRSFALIGALGAAALAAVAAWGSGASTLAIIVAPLLSSAVLGIGGVVGWVAWRKISFLRRRRASLLLPMDMDEVTPEPLPDDLWTHSVRSIAPPPADVTLHDFETRDTQVEIDTAAATARAADGPEDPDSAVFRIGESPAATLVAAAMPEPDTGERDTRTATTQPPAAGESDTRTATTQPPAADASEAEGADLQSEDAHTASSQFAANDERDDSSTDERRVATDAQAAESVLRRAMAQSVNSPAPVAERCAPRAAMSACSPLGCPRISGDDAADFHETNSENADEHPPEPMAVGFSSVADFERWAESMPPSDIVVAEDERAVGWI
ncbi:MAG: HDOD domain-containing protein [Polyangiaceae bacterium]